MWARPGEGRTARIWAIACGPSWAFPGESGTSCAGRSTPVNAIICASRRDMIGATLYLVGKEVPSGEYVENAMCCSMCKRMVINAGIEQVIVRDDRDHYRVIDVAQWVADDESLKGVLGY